MLFNLYFVKIALLAIVFLAQIKKRSLSVSFVKYFFLFSFLTIFGINLYYSFLQYQIWASDKIGQYFITEDKSYFPRYLFTHKFFEPYLISLAVALFSFFILRILNRKAGSRFFYDEEPYLCALAIFLSGNPGWFFYLITLFSFHLFLSFFFLIKNKIKSINENTSRVSFLYLWLPSALFVILLSGWLSKFYFWYVLEI